MSKLSATMLGMRNEQSKKEKERARCCGFKKTAILDTVIKNGNKAAVLYRTRNAG